VRRASSPARAVCISNSKLLMGIETIFLVVGLVVVVAIIVASKKAAKK
jgi:hypothetical protein